MNLILKEQLLLQFYNAPEKEIKQAIKYQEKFSLTLENLKCLNPDCNNIRKWFSVKNGFGYTCGNNICKKKVKDKVTNIRNLKIKNNYFKKTGYSNPSQNPEVMQKKIDTSLQKYGVKYPNQNLEVKQKSINTCLKKYGTISSNQYPEIKQKKIDTNLHKYGVKNFNQYHITNFKDWNDKQFWIDNFLTKDKYLDYIKSMEYFNCKEVRIWQKAKEMEINYSKFGNSSLKEQAIIPILNSLGIYNIISNTKKIINPLELDIYLPDHNLAIEYNGLYWHSYHETIKTSSKQLDFNYMKYRHQQKSLACIEKGIRLLHIYENDLDIEQKIINFINYKPNLGQKEYDLDSGCYPLGLKYEVIEPENRIVLNNRLLFNAGKIKI